MVSYFLRLWLHSTNARGVDFIGGDQQFDRFRHRPPAGNHLAIVGAYSISGGFPPENERYTCVSGGERVVSDSYEDRVAVDDVVEYGAAQVGSLQWD